MIRRSELKFFAQLTGLMAGALGSMTVAANARSGLVSGLFGVLALAMLVAVFIRVIRD